MSKDFCWSKCFRMDRLYCLFYSMIGIHYRNYVMMNSPTFLEDSYGRELVWPTYSETHNIWHFSSARIVCWSASSHLFCWWALWSIKPGPLWSGIGLSGAVWMSQHKSWWKRDILLLLPSLSLRLLNINMIKCLNSEVLLNPFQTYLSCLMEWKTWIEILSISTISTYRI